MKATCEDEPQVEDELAELSAAQAGAASAPAVPTSASVVELGVAGLPGVLVFLELG